MVQHDSIFTYSCTMCLAEVPVSKQRLKNQPEVYGGLPIFNSLEKRLEMKHAQPVIFFSRARFRVWSMYLLFCQIKQMKLNITI